MSAAKNWGYDQCPYCGAPHGKEHLDHCDIAIAAPPDAAAPDACATYYHCDNCNHPIPYQKIKNAVAALTPDASSASALTEEERRIVEAGRNTNTPISASSSHWLVALIDRLAPDAARYRWMREQTGAADPEAPKFRLLRAYRLEALDAAIDAMLRVAGPTTPPDAAAPSLVIDAQHGETGRMWRGRKADLPHGYYEVAPTIAPYASASVLTATLDKVVELTAERDRLARELATRNNYDYDIGYKTGKEGAVPSLTAERNCAVAAMEDAQAGLALERERVTGLERKCKNQRGQLHQLQNAHDVLWKVIGLYLDRVHGYRVESK